MSQKEALLVLKDFMVSFTTEHGTITPVLGVNLTISPGERIALVGESGCGKSMTALGLTGLSPTDRAQLSGSAVFKGRELVGSPDAVNAARRGGVAYVFQDPSGALNPVMRICDQIGEVLRDLTRAQREARVRELIADVGLPDPDRIYRSYPCELSGGQQQRIMLAIALAMDPALLIADEPTTALDVTTQRQILSLMDDLARKRNMAVLLITHNLGIVAAYMDRIYVMYAGRIIEEGSVIEVLHEPRHPYTKGLLGAVPTLSREQKILQDIPGTVPSPGLFPIGCGFAPRCREAQDICHTDLLPEMCACAPGHTLRCHLVLTSSTPEQENAPCNQN